MVANLTMGRGGRAALLVALALIARGGVTAAQQKARPAPAGTQAQQQAPPSAKTQAILDLLERQAPPDAVREALKKAHLTKEEEAALARQLQNPRYKAAFEQARRKATASRPSKPSQPQPRVGPSLAELRQAAERDHAALVARLEREAQPVLQQARAAAARPAPSQRLAPTAMASLGAARAPANPSRVIIDRIDPEVAIVGAPLRIRGRYMGPPGEVTIIVGAEDPRPENAYVCPFVAWNAEDIAVTVPAQIEEMHRAHPFPDGRRSALLWVKPRNDPSGKTLEIQLSINPRRFMPSIDTVSPTQLTPGLRFVIRGQSLAAGRRPTVRLNVRVGTETLRRELQVLGYSETYIEAYVQEDTSGIPASDRAYVEVENALGTSPQQPTDFIPAEEVLTIPGKTSKACCFSLLEPENPAFSFGYSDWTGCWEPWLFCTWGEKVESRPFANLPIEEGSSTVLVPLANGWKVVNVTMETRRSHLFDDAGCVLESTPAAGGVEFRGTEVLAWANAYGQVKCVPSLVIRGPRGVRYNP